MSDSLSREERIYDQVLRMVLWGEPEEAVVQKLEANGYTGEAAAQIYAEARKARISAIRGDCWRSFAWGLLWFGCGVGVFCQFWFVFGGITRTLLMLTVVAATIGTWKMTAALVGWVAAPFKQGSLADND